VGAAAEYDVRNEQTRRSVSGNAYRSKILSPETNGSGLNHFSTLLRNGGEANFTFRLGCPHQKFLHLIAVPNDDRVSHQQTDHDCSRHSNK